VRIVGDLDDLLPGDPPSSAAVDPAASSAEQLLAAARAGLVGLAKEYADLAVTHKAGRVARREAQRAGRAELQGARRPGPIRRAAARMPGARAVASRLRGTT
jgi:hypothetical protein